MQYFQNKERTLKSTIKNNRIKIKEKENLNISMSKLCLNHRVSLFFSLGGGGSWLTDQSTILPCTVPASLWYVWVGLILSHVMKLADNLIRFEPQALLAFNILTRLPALLFDISSGHVKRKDRTWNFNNSF